MQWYTDVGSQDPENLKTWFLTQNGEDVLLFSHQHKLNETSPNRNTWT